MCQSHFRDIQPGCWVYFDWAGYTSGLNHILSSQSSLSPFSYAKVVTLKEEALEVQTTAGEIAVITYKSSIRKLPNPIANIGEEVVVSAGSASGCTAKIDSFFWHHKDSEFKYTLKINGKRKSRRYSANDLSVIN